MHLLNKLEQIYLHIEIIIYSTIYSLIILIVLNANYLCENDNLDLVIRNNINGDFSIIERIKEIKPGAFINIYWKDKKLMLPYSPRYNTLSFSDKKWDWRYQINKNGSINESNPILYELLPSGIVKEHPCQINDT